MLKKFISLELFLIYTFPLGFLAVYFDFYNDSNLGYLLFTVLLCSFAFLSGFTKKNLPIIIGNISSFVTSLLCINYFKDQPNWDLFFSMFSTTFILIAFTIISLPLQYFSFKKGLELNNNKNKKYDADDSDNDEFDYHDNAI